MHHRPRRTFGYVRVSGDEQGRTGTSLAAQREEIERYCSARGWTAPVIFSEVESGSEDSLAERVELRRLVDEVQPGDAVIVAKVDRWSRDLVHGVASVRALVKRGVGWFSTGDALDASTAQGDSTLGIMAWVSDNERKRIIERTVGRRHQLRDAGLWVEGPPPFGFRRDAATRRLVVVESEAVVVREVYARCIGGESVATIARSLRAAGVGRAGQEPIKWDKKAVHNLVRRRWYLGEMRRTDGTWRPAHPAIVDVETFDRAQAAMAARRLGGRTASASSRTSGWLLRGLALCGSCGSRVGAAYSRGIGADGYYACADRLRGGECDEPYARVSVVDAAMGAAVVRRLEAVRHLLGDATAEQAPADRGRLDALRKSLDGQRQRRARLLSLAVDGLLTKDELSSRLQRLDAETASLEAAERDEQRRASPATAEVRAAALKDVVVLRKAWQKMRVEKRREVVAMLIERIELRGGKAVASWASVESLCQATVGRDLSDGTVDLSAKRPLKKAGAA